MYFMLDIRLAVSEDFSIKCCAFNTIQNVLLLNASRLLRKKNLIKLSA